MNELFIIAGFLALLANIFYCVFWMSREVWRHFAGKEMEHTEMQEEYLKVLDSDFYDGRRPWSLSIPTENHMIDAAREQIKKHGYTEFGVDFGPLPDCDNTLKVCWPIPGVPDSNGDIYSQDAVDSMQMAMQANSKGILDNFQDIDKVWMNEYFGIDPKLIKRPDVNISEVNADYPNPIPVFGKSSFITRERFEELKEGKDVHTNGHYRWIHHEGVTYIDSVL